MASNALALLEGDTLRLRGVLDRAAVIALWPQLQALPAKLARLELGYSYAQITVATGRPSTDAARMAVRRALVHLAEEMGSG